MICDLQKSWEGQILTRLDNLPRVRLDEELPSIQMGQDEPEATKSLGETQSVFIEEVLTLSLELGMFFLLENKDYISSDCIRLHIETFKLSIPQD